MTPIHVKTTGGEDMLRAAQNAREFIHGLELYCWVPICVTGTSVLLLYFAFFADGVAGRQTVVTTLFAAVDAVLLLAGFLGSIWVLVRLRAQAKEMARPHSSAVAPPAVALSEEETLLEEDTPMISAPPRFSGVLRVHLTYAGRSKPAPLDDEVDVD